MKTTNFEISKKLKEAVFRAESYFAWVKFDGQEKPELKTSLNLGEQLSAEQIVPAYDLETILDALPKGISGEKLESFEYVEWAELQICYRDLYYGNSYTLIGYESHIFILSCEQEKNESLADTAGRLLLLLHDRNLIKF